MFIVDGSWKYAFTKVQQIVESIVRNQKKRVELCRENYRAIT